jgi:hypothetical protein|nr:MAG TPA: tail-collar fiber protein [Bacteriophage sp.]
MKFYLTEAGSRKLASIVTGSTITITKAISSDIVSSEPKRLVEMAGRKQSLQVNSVNIENNVAVVKLTLTNLDVTEEYQLKQIGIYARFGTEEILFIVGQDRVGEKIPAIAEREIEYDYQISFAFDTAAEVKISVSANDFIKKMEALNLLHLKVDKTEYVNKITDMKRVTVVNVPADRWIGSGPWTQILQVATLKDGDTPTVSQHISEGESRADIIKAQEKAYGCINKGIVSNGELKLMCYVKKPKAAFFIAIKGE